MHPLPLTHLVTAREESLRGTRDRARHLHVPGRQSPDEGVPAARRRLLGDALAIGVSVVGFGLVYGMAARAAGFSLLDLEAMNLLVFAGGSQLMAIGMLATGAPWLAIVAVTVVLNARHLLYGVSLAPWFAGRPLRERALAAYAVVDESFALLGPLRRLGTYDRLGFALVAGMLISSWLLSTWLGWTTAMDMPAQLDAALAVAAPAAIAGMAVLLVTDRLALVAMVAGGATSLAVGLALGGAVGIVAGALVGTGVASLGRRRLPGWLGQRP